MGGMYPWEEGRGGRTDDRGSYRSGRGQSHHVWRSAGVVCESENEMGYGSTSEVVLCHDHYEREVHVENVNGSVQEARTARP